MRFDSIDAPEMSQPWGREAYAELVKRLNQQVVWEVIRTVPAARLVESPGDDLVRAVGMAAGAAHQWRRLRRLRRPGFCSEAEARAAGWRAPQRP